MTNNEPDFSIRNLAEYSVQELESLLGAVLIAKFEHRHGDDDEKQRLDIWGYIIKDALSQSKKREQQS